MFWNRKKSAGKTLEDKLAEARETVSELLKNADSLPPEEQQELKSLVAAAGVASATMRAAQTIEQADDFGDRMHEQTMKMIEEAHAMTMGVKNKSAPDPKALEKAAKRLERLIEKEKARAAEEQRRAAAPIRICKPIKLKTRRP